MIQSSLYVEIITFKQTINFISFGEHLNMFHMSTGKDEIIIQPKVTKNMFKYDFPASALNP